MGRSKVSALTTLVMSHLGHVEQGGHARATFLPRGGGEQDVAVVAWRWPAPGAATFSARPWARAFRVGVDDLGDTGDLGGGLRCGTGVGTGHQHVHVAAARAARSPLFKVALSCSAMTRRCRVPSITRPVLVSDYLGFVLELVHQGGDIGHLDAGAALGRLGDLQGLDARRHVHAQVGGLDGVQRLFLAFMMLGSVT